MELSIQERLKDLRVERELTLEQLGKQTHLGEQTHLSKSALGSYEAEDFKDISHYTLSSGETQTESAAQTGTVSTGMGNMGESHQSVQVVNIAVKTKQDPVLPDI